MFNEEFFTKEKRNIFFLCLIVLTIANILYSAFSEKVLLFDGISRFGQLLSGISARNPLGFTNFYLRYSLLHYTIQLPIFLVGLFIKSKTLLIWLFAIAYYSVQPLLLCLNYSLAKRRNNFSTFLFASVLYVVLFISAQTHPMFEMPILTLLALSVYQYLKLENPTLKDKIIPTFFCAIIFGSIETTLIFAPIILAATFFGKPNNKPTANLTRIACIVAITGYIISSIIKSHAGINPFQNSEFVFFAEALKFNGIKFLGLTTISLSCIALFGVYKNKLWKLLLIIIFALVAKALITNCYNIFEAPVQFYTRQIFYIYLLPILFYGYVIFEICHKEFSGSEKLDLIFSEKFEMITLTTSAFFIYYFSQFVSDSRMFYMYIVLIAIILIILGYLFSGEKTAKFIKIFTKILCQTVIISFVLFIIIKRSMYNAFLLLPVILFILSYKNIYLDKFKDDNDTYKKSFITLLLIAGILQTVVQFQYGYFCKKYIDKFKEIQAKIEQPIFVFPENLQDKMLNLTPRDCELFPKYVRPPMYPAFSIILSDDYDVKSIILPSKDSLEVQGTSYFNDISIEQSENKVMFFYSFYDVKNRYWDFSKLIPEIENKKNELM